MCGAAYIADLAGVDQIVKRAQGFFLRMSQGRAVKLVKVNLIGLQALERIFTGFDDMVACSASIIWQITNAPKHLSGQYNPLTQIVFFQELPSDSLALSFVVDICAVEKIDSGVHSLLHDRKRLCFVRRLTEIHRSQT